MYEYKATLDRVIDGDTVDFNIDLGFNVILTSKRVRLALIDTPEKRTRDLVEKHFGIIATHYVVQKLVDATTIRLQTRLTSGNDKYGRLLGEIYVDGEPKSINEQLIDLRYAVRYTGQNKADVEQAHINNRNYLMENNLVNIPTKIKVLMRL